MDLKAFLYESVGENSFSLSKEERSTLLALDKEYGYLIKLFRTGRNFKDVLNIKSETEKFLDYRKNGIKYYPKLKYSKCTYEEDNLVPQLKMLKAKFLKFNCYLSKFYIENLDDYIAKAEYTIKKFRGETINHFQYDIPSYEDYEAALETIKKHPYEKVDDNARNKDAKEAQKLLQDFIKKQGFKWKVELSDDMLPRMNVDTDQKMRIHTTAKFSDEDIEGLEQHEIMGHIGRRYYGMKTGLNLFLYGLVGRNTLDEGLAVWNSLNKVKKQKQNILFNVALKTVLSFNLNTMDFCTLVEMVKDLAPNMPDDKAFTTVVRAKREIIDMSMLGGYMDDASYFCGYRMIDKMDDKMRDDILKYNIGPSQISELPNIKKFLEENKFDSLI